MEQNQKSSLPPEFNETSRPDVKTPRRKGFFIIPAIVILILLFGGGYFVMSKKYVDTKSNQITKENPSPTSTNEQQVAGDNFFRFAIPKALDKLTPFDLPNDQNPKGIVKIDDALWFSGDGSIIEYDTKAKMLVSYTDSNMANCDGNMVYVSGFLFAACHFDNIDDAFGTVHKLTTPIYTGHSGIYKIDPKAHKIVHIFNTTDGLLNGYNLQIYPDDGYVWVATFNGVGRINAQTNQVDFYTSALGFQKTSQAKSYSIFPLLIDKDYVWAWNTASVESRGGIALFDKKTEAWKAFGPKELKDNSFDRIDLDFSDNWYAAKLIPGGIQIGFRDGEIGTADRFIEKQYMYDTGKWTKVNSDRVATGEESEATRSYIAQTYPKPLQSYNVIETEGLSQIQSSDAKSVYQLDGRNNFALSPVIENKRYILTSATVDVVDTTYPFRKIVTKLGERLVDGVYFSDPSAYQDLVRFLVEPTTLKGIVAKGGCEGMGCDNTQKVWLINLKTGKIEKVYTAADNLPGGETFNQKLTLSKQGDVITIVGEDKLPLFSINLVNYVLTPLTTPTPLPTQ